MCSTTNDSSCVQQVDVSSTCDDDEVRHPAPAMPGAYQMADPKHGVGGSYNDEVNDVVISVNAGGQPAPVFALGSSAPAGHDQPSSVSASPGGVYLSHKNPVSRTMSSR